MDATGSSKSGGSLKKQMVAVLAALDESSAIIDTQKKQIEYLNDEKERLEGLLNEKEEALNARVSREIIDLKEEMEHKFALQVAENKRLQHHITLQKKESEKLGAALLALQERMQLVENEVIDED
eukprot:CAMPEP_0203824500 /NCGR_PEP_ID=MMETSP0115-20131106/51920_1 /ASSEMBLY_ACC=CAM_ASM_000227 /TAXON_ID=33651 /ORGANISM="Bicosoecid sp, Strain ms1" /LENGTH=124 /DNA_ID=CAMNT_0050733539 /DNA_START=104 /DNA_END=478 /DNA_ORIENTATION=-